MMVFIPALNSLWGDLEGYFGARYYDSKLGIWLSPDPLADEYPSSSPYVYCGNNPVGNKDPNGMYYNPIYSWDGTFMGPDSWGFQGMPIFMNSSDYYPGMPHAEALGLGTLFSDVPLVIHPDILSSVENHSAMFLDNSNWNNVVVRDPNLYIQHVGWQQGMPTDFSLLGHTFVVPSNSNNYVNVTNQNLRQGFETSFRTQNNIQGKYWSPIADIRWFEGLMGAACSYSINPPIFTLASPFTSAFQTPSVSNVFDRATNKHHNKLKNYYRQYGIIR